MGLREIGLVLLYALVAALAGPLFVWLRAQANKVKLLAQSEVDDYVLGALKIGVLNVANDQRAKIEALHPLTTRDKVYLESLAEQTASAILNAKGIKLSDVANAKTISALIRFLVDENKKP